MKPFRLLFFFLFCSVLSAQAPTPLARGNTPGELHHQLVLENRYFRAYNVIVPPHDSTLLHRHDEDYLYVAIGPADIVNAVLDKPEIHAQLKDGEIHFVRGGFSHVAKNLSDAPFHNVTIALLRPQGAVRNLCEQIVPGPLGKCARVIHGKKDSASDLFETDGLRVRSTLLGPKVTMSGFAERDRLIVVLDQGELEVSSRGNSPVRLHASDVLWLPASPFQTFTNLASGQSRFLSIYFRLF